MDECPHFWRHGMTRRTDDQDLGTDDQDLGHYLPQCCGTWRGPRVCSLSGRYVGEDKAPAESSLPGKKKESPMVKINEFMKWDQKTLALRLDAALMVVEQIEQQRDDLLDTYAAGIAALEAENARLQGERDTLEIETERLRTRLQRIWLLSGHNAQFEITALESLP